MQFVTQSPSSCLLERMVLPWCRTSRYKFWVNSSYLFGWCGRNKDIENNITIDLHAQHVNEALEHLRRHLQSLSSIPCKLLQLVLQYMVGFVLDADVCHLLSIVYRIIDVVGASVY